MYILGIHYYGHNTSVALFKNNKLLFAIEEERLSRKKNDGSIPYLGISEILKKYKLKINDIKVISFATIPEKLIKEKYLKYTLEDYANRKEIFFEEKSFENLRFLNTFEKNFKKKLGFHNKIFFFNHHLCHLYASYYLSGFKDALCVSIDGLGEIESTMIGSIKSNKHKIIKSINYPHSLGKVYEAITFFLGFNPSTSAGTVMALAAMGNARKKLTTKLDYYQVFKNIIKDDKKDIYKIDTTWFNFPFSRNGWVSNKFIKFFGKKRPVNSKSFSEHHKSIASALQKRFEEIYVKIIKHGQKKTSLKNLVLSGGCVLNCKANGELNKLNFDKIYIQPASGDSGLSIGAAKMAYNFIKKNKVLKNAKFNHTYLGTEIKDHDIKFFAKKYNLKLKKFSNIEKIAASYIFNNKIIGWVQGRSEFGPRALGNRSILAAPNSIHIKNKINKNIKKRQFFRPFAPSILDEHYKKIYISKYESPFMLMAIKANKMYHEKIKGTLHFDNTARVQAVTKLTNRKYYKLISEYYKISGIPLVLNTSFNGKDVPIVNSAKDAILEFKKIKLDALFINNYLINL